MARVSNRQILDAVDLLATEISEAVSSQPYPDPLFPAMTLEAGEYYGISDVLEAATKCYQLYHHNPLFRRAVELRTQYVWGRGVTMMSPQKVVDNVIRDFLDRNDRELGHRGRAEKDKTLTLEGNLFFLCSVDEMGAVAVQTVPLQEIAETRRDPDDYRSVWFWKRTFTVYEQAPDGSSGPGTEMSTYHPSLDHTPTARAAQIDGIDVRWDQPILHAPLPRIGKELYSMPPFLSVVPWATSYSRFLSNIASISASLARFAMRATAKTPEGAKRLRTLLDVSTGERKAADDKQVTGSTFVSTDGVALEPIKTAGVATDADEGRRFALMVASGTDTPEHMLMGDPSTGNLATTKSMERPFELAILDRQLWWADVLERLLAFAVTCRLMAPGYDPIRGTVEEDEFGRTQILIYIDRDEDSPATEPGDPAGADDAPEEAEIVVTFPSVLEHDMVSEITAIIDMATLRGQSMANIVDTPTLRRLLLAALNIPDVDDLIAGMDIDALDAEPEEEEPEPPPAFLQPPPFPGEDDTAPEDSLNNVAEALREFVRAAREETS